MLVVIKSVRYLPFAHSHLIMTTVLAVFVLLYMLNPTTSQLPDPPKTNYDKCRNFTNDARIDCAPINPSHATTNRDECESRGCCWLEVDVPNVPYCFYPEDYGGYKVTKVSEVGNTMDVELKRQFKSGYPRDVVDVRVFVEKRTNDIVYVKISDLPDSRFRPDIPLQRNGSTFHLYTDEPAVRKENYVVKYDKDNFGVRVVRKQKRKTIFQLLSDGFIFSDQFLQVTSLLPSNVNIYGLGERRGPLNLGTDWQKHTMFNSDAAPNENANLYGTYPFYLAVEDDGTSHGVLLINSNAMEINIQPRPAITFRTLGGIFEFFIFTGPTPQNVLSSYLSVIGPPMLPPAWSLGFHLCRWGITLNEAKEVLDKNVALKIPVDVQWFDLDYMDNNNDFTLNNETYPNFIEFVNDLHAREMKLVPILDPGVSAAEKPGSYPPYDSGLKQNVFVKNQNNDVLIGKVWNPVSTAFPDFTNPAIFNYWTDLLRTMHDVTAYDGLWLDMGEPSNMVDGSLHGCPNSELENPQWIPKLNGNSLKYKTVCMTAKHSTGTHYNVHNIYGLHEIRMSYKSLTEIIPNKRPFILSRTGYAGLGHYAAHWEGDNSATWHDLRRSVSFTLTSSLFGLSMTGADICGFNSNTQSELCARWYQLGAFYPFSRTHNTLGDAAQDPASMDVTVQTAARNALEIRYSLFPYLYTSVYHAHKGAGTFATPLFMEFTSDARTAAIDEQFLLGRALMVAPVLYEGARSVTAYLPAGTWYAYDSYAIYFSNKGMSVTVDAALDVIPIFIRAGFILPTQTANMTIAATRRSSLRLLVALDAESFARGYLYWDDGESLDYANEKFAYVELTAESSCLRTRFLNDRYAPLPNVSSVTVIGVFDAVETVSLNNDTEPVSFAYSSDNQLLQVDSFNVALDGFVLSWH